MVSKYIPKQGDIVYIDFNPTKGHEQKGKRPAIVISTNVFNKYTKMAIVCPITSNEKEFPTHYLLKNSNIIHGSVLCEHIRSLDYEVRQFTFVEKASDEDLMNVSMLVSACFEE